MISGCSTVDPIPHPAIKLPTTPMVKPYFKPDELNCQQTPIVCKKITQREKLLKYHIETIRGIVELHNKQLEDQ